MDYTRSKDHVVHTGTGNRMHDDTQPNTTVFSANDVNQVNWSLMEVIKAAGLEGKTFNPDDASSYHVLQNALKAQFAPIDSVTALANEMAGKVDRVIDGKQVRYVIDAYNDGTNWYRKWSDGWLEQGGLVQETVDGKHYYNLLLPYRDANYHVLASI